jgi:hypothetical protein
MNGDKRELREQKRILKRKGNQHNRREVRRRLAEHPRKRPTSRSTSAGSEPPA